MHAEAAGEGTLRVLHACDFDGGGGPPGARRQGPAPPARTVGRWRRASRATAEATSPHTPAPPAQGYKMTLKAETGDFSAASRSSLHSLQNAACRGQSAAAQRGQQ